MKTASKAESPDETLTITDTDTYLTIEGADDKTVEEINLRMVRQRLKVHHYYKGQKIAIRHQNGVLDFERETQVDKGFYNLPLSLQASIKHKMELMTENDQAIFLAGWQLAMKNKKTTFNEIR
jgi:hypothetical protein